MLWSIILSGILLFIICWKGITHRLVDPSAWANNVDLAKFTFCNVEHPLQLHPVPHVGFLKDGTRGTGRVFLD